MKTKVMEIFLVQCDQPGCTYQKVISAEPEETNIETKAGLHEFQQLGIPNKPIQIFLCDQCIKDDGDIELVDV